MATHANPSTQSLAIDHVTILDGRGGPAMEHARVLVRAGRIVSIASASQPLRKDVKVIDARGQFLLPGFIDMHAHLLFPRCSNGAPRFDRKLSERALSAQLSYGITTVRSPATPTVEGLRLRDDLNANKVRGPRAYAAAELINDASLSDAQLRQLVDQAMRYEPNYIKVYARLQPAQVATVIKQAHRHRISVIGHLQTTSWAQGLALGIDHLVHSVDWSIASLPPAKRAAYAQALQTRGGFRARIDWLEAFDPNAQQALLSALARKQISVDLTLIAYDAKFSAPDARRYRANKALQAFPELRADWQNCNDATANWTAQDYHRWQMVRPKLLAWVKRMHDAGVLLVTGTDLTNEWIAPGEGLHQEFELLKEAGLSANQILAMTGANAAQALARDDVGIVAEGRRADLVLLGRDPRQSISNTRSIVWVMQGGKIVSKHTTKSGAP